MGLKCYAKNRSIRLRVLGLEFYFLFLLARLQNCFDRSHATQYENSLGPLDLALSILHCGGLPPYGRCLYEAHASLASPCDYFRVTGSAMDGTYPASCSGTSSGDTIEISIRGLWGWVGQGSGLHREHRGFGFSSC